MSPFMQYFKTTILGGIFVNTLPQNQKLLDIALMILKRIVLIIYKNCIDDIKSEKQSLSKTDIQFSSYCHQKIYEPKN